MVLMLNFVNASIRELDSFPGRYFWTFQKTNVGVSDTSIFTDGTQILISQIQEKTINTSEILNLHLIPIDYCVIENCNKRWYTVINFNRMKQIKKQLMMCFNFHINDDCKVLSVVSVMCFATNHIITKYISFVSVNIHVWNNNCKIYLVFGISSRSWWLTLIYQDLNVKILSCSVT